MATMRRTVRALTESVAGPVVEGRLRASGGTRLDFDAIRGNTTAVSIPDDGSDNRDFWFVAATNWNGSWSMGYAGGFGDAGKKEAERKLKEVSAYNKAGGPNSDPKQKLMIVKATGNTKQATKAALDAVTKKIKSGSQSEGVGEAHMNPTAKALLESVAARLPEAAGAVSISDRVGDVDDAVAHLLRAVDTAKDAGPQGAGAAGRAWTKLVEVVDGMEDATLALTKADKAWRAALGEAAPAAAGAALGEGKLGRDDVLRKVGGLAGTLVDEAQQVQAAVDKYARDPRRYAPQLENAREAVGRVARAAKGIADGVGALQQQGEAAPGTALGEASASEGLGVALENVHTAFANATAEAVRAWMKKNALDGTVQIFSANPGGAVIEVMVNRKVHLFSYSVQPGGIKAPFVNAIIDSKEMDVKPGAFSVKLFSDAIIKAIG